MKLSEMRQILTERDIRLTKSLGQNFLHDANQLRRIAAAAELTRNDRVLEVGPGLGPLTELLLQEAGEVLAIEKDGRLVELLEQRFITAAAAQTVWVSPAPKRTGETPVFQLLHDDALDYLVREARDWSGWKLVANLPYSVASPILVELAWAGLGAAVAQTVDETAPPWGGGQPVPLGAGERRARGPQRLVATLQIEVAKRLFAQPGTADYGLLTLLVQLDYEPRSWFKIPASCFFPAPEVDSACVCLVRRSEPLLPLQQWGAFSRMIKRSFSQRRKMMMKLLRADWRLEELQAAFAQLGLSASTRAESVSLPQFVALTQLMYGRRDL
jgi:16S rRNA (adenine1518-N6/adenine1519-N6)-dimethyltransferase